jgi:hypothetical protein
VSPELALVDPVLAARARADLLEPPAGYLLRDAATETDEERSAALRRIVEHAEEDEPSPSPRSFGAPKIAAALALWGVAALLRRRPGALRLVGLAAQAGVSPASLMLG